MEKRKIHCSLEYKPKYTLCGLKSTNIKRRNHKIVFVKKIDPTIKQILPFRTPPEYPVCQECIPEKEHIMIEENFE